MQPRTARTSHHENQNCNNRLQPTNDHRIHRDKQRTRAHPVQLVATKKLHLPKELNKSIQKPKPSTQEIPKDNTPNEIREFQGVDGADASRLQGHERQQLIFRPTPAPGGPLADPPAPKAEQQGAVPSPSQKKEERRLFSVVVLAPNQPSHNDTGTGTAPTQCIARAGQQTPKNRTRLASMTRTPRRTTHTLDHAPLTVPPRTQLPCGRAIHNVIARPPSPRQPRQSAQLPPMFFRSPLLPFNPL